MEKKMTTGDLLAGLFKTESIDKYFEKMVGPDLPSFSDYIREMSKSRGETPQHVIKRSGIERTYGHQIFNGTRKPSRDKVIQFAIGFSADVEETQKMLRIAEKNELYPRIKRDALLLYCITHNMKFDETQKMLKRFDLQPLGDKPFGNE
jgi:transcriptional regulator with XRE-family HTH domain